MAYSNEWNEDMLEDLKDENYMYRKLTGKYFTRITAEELENFNNLNISKKKSYAVLCEDYRALKKFMLAYILQFHPEAKVFDNKFVSCNFKTYFEITINKENLVVPDDKILILHYHKQYSTSGGYGHFNFERIASEIVKRCREDEVSIILAEKLITTPIKDSNKTFNLLEELKDELKIVYLNDDLSLNTNGEIKKSKQNGGINWSKTK